MQKKIYIGGKVTGLPIDEVRIRFANKHRELLAAGHDPLSPVHLVEEMGIQNEPWDYIMKLCIVALVNADELHLLPCWQDSRGAVLEHDIAQRLGMTIVYPS